MNIDADDNPEKIKNLEPPENTRQSTRSQITTKPSHRVIWYNTSNPLQKANSLTIKFPASQALKSHQYMVKVLVMLT